MSVYLDASVIVPFFTKDFFSDRARTFLLDRSPLVMVGDFAGAEFVSVLARRVRTGELTPELARLATLNFDSWTARYAMRVEMSPTDIRTADAILRRFDLPLRAPDAIHIAVSQRLGAELATFDEKLIACAHSIGLSISPI